MSKIISGSQIGSASRMHVISSANFQPSLEMFPFVVCIMVVDHKTRPRAETLPRIHMRTVFRILSDETIIRRPREIPINQTGFPRSFRFIQAGLANGEKAPEFLYRSPIERGRIKPNLNGANGLSDIEHVAIQGMELLGKAT